MDQVECAGSINLHERNPFESCLFIYFSNSQINASISAKYDSKIKVNCFSLAPLMVQKNLLRFLH